MRHVKQAMGIRFYCLFRAETRSMINIELFIPTLSKREK